MWASDASKCFPYKYLSTVTNGYALNKIFLKSNPDFGEISSSRKVVPQKNTENVVACRNKSFCSGQPLLP